MSNVECLKSEDTATLVSLTFDFQLSTFDSLELRLASSEVVHRVIYAKNCAKDEVKQTNWQNCLPKTNEMEAKRYTAEGTIVLYGTNNLSGSRFWLLYWQKRRFHAVEHTRVDEVGCNGGHMYIGCHLL